MLVADVHRVWIRRDDRLDRLEVAAVGGRGLGIDHRLVGEDDVRGGERLIVVPSHVGAQLEREIETIAAVLPGLGQLADEVEVLVVLDEAVVDQRADLERGPVAEHVRDQARDVALQRLDVGVAVRRLARRLSAREIHRAVRFAPAPGDGEQEEQPEEAQRNGPAHPHRQRGWLGVGGAGSAGAAGVGDAGAAGALAGGGAASRTTELPRSPPRIASVNDVIVKTIAMPVVILPSKVGVPIDPNTAWLPAPPNAEPMSAPFPDCSRTMPMMAKHARTWMMISAMCIRSLLGGGADARRFADDPDESLRVEARAPDERPIDLGLGEESVGVLGLDAAPVQNAHGLRDLLGRELGEEPAQVALHLVGPGGRRA